MAEVGDPGTRAPVELPVSIYFVWQWWEEHYQKQFGRPETIDMDWLDEHYLGRQRFLYDHFGSLGIGAAHPVLNPEFLSKVMPFHTMLIAVALGMETAIQPTGGYAWKTMNEEALRNLRAVDIANTGIGERILRDRRLRLDRYGTATQMIDLASVTNNAFMMRGANFYADLLVDTDFAHHYLGVIAETMCHAYDFISRTFAPIEGFPLANCNVTMISPALYDEMISRYDISCVEHAAKVTGQPPCCDLHHCDVKTEPFIASYGRIPGLRSLQGSYQSDIRAIRDALPGVAFSAMVSPVEVLQRPEAELVADIEKSIADGANDLAIWDIDTACVPERMESFFGAITEAASRQGRRAVFSVIPFSWEELAWEFPQYVPSTALRVAPGHATIC